MVVNPSITHLVDEGYLAQDPAGCWGRKHHRMVRFTDTYEPGACHNPHPRQIICSMTLGMDPAGLDQTKRMLSSDSQKTKLALALMTGRMWHFMWPLKLPPKKCAGMKEHRVQSVTKKEKGFSKVPQGATGQKRHIDEVMSEMGNWASSTVLERDNLAGERNGTIITVEGESSGLNNKKSKAARQISPPIDQ